MLASGRALEGWAAGRARRDLSGLLARAPSTARRYRDGSLDEVPLGDIGPGDLLLVAHGDVVPADGTVASGRAVLDESALTGEPLPVEHPQGDQVRSGVVNAGGPFDLAITTRAEESTYAGIVRLVREAEESQAPFVRLADRYALWFVLITLVAAAAHLGSRRCLPGRGRPGGRHAVPADPGGPGRARGRDVGSRAAGRGRQGRRGPRAARPVHNPAAGQDRDADQRAPVGVGDRQRGPAGARRDPPAGGVAGPGLRSRAGRCGGPRRPGPRAASWQCPTARRK